MRLDQIGEFALIEQLCRELPIHGPGVLVGPGDDAAIVKVNSSQQILTTDVLVEGVDFDLRYTDPESAGHKSLAANLSDIAAMAGIPDHILVSWGAPGSTDVHTLLRLARGLGHLARQYGVSVVGGDVSAALELFISVTVIGHTGPSGAICYDSARPGDGIYVTGTLGDSLLGLKLLQSGRAMDGPYFARRHLRPEPRVREALALVEACPVTALTDISDGLSRDLNKLCGASRVGAVLDEELIPCAEGFQEVAESLGLNPIEAALAGGEDFELLFTVAESSSPPDVFGLASRIGTSVTRIGIIQSNTNVIILDRDKRSRELPPGGWEHFSAKIH